MTLRPHEIQILRSACQTHGIALSKRITDSEALHRLAQEKLSAIRAEVEPVTDGMTVQSYDEIANSILTWPSKAAREAVAVKLELVSHQNVLDSWIGMASSMRSGLRKPFNEAGMAYSAGDRSDEVVAVLCSLARVRNLIALWGRTPEIGSIPFERYTRFVRIPSMKKFIEWVVPRTSAHEMSDPEFWRIITAIEGVVIEWHDESEQRAMWDSLRLKMAD